jgi:Cu(I)/Ag(I) efflux system membrane protein CusA/SilA
MIVAAILSITLDPAIRVTLTHFSEKSFKPRWLSKIRNAVLVGKTHSEDEHPISKFLFKVYGPMVDWVVQNHFKVVVGAVAILLLSLPAYFKLGSEFMPPLNEGTILYMPTTMPGISVTSAQDLLQRQDLALKSFPEVERVFGKAGRADTSTDPAPFSMMETTVILKPQDQWRKTERWYSFLPEFLQTPFTLLWPNHLSWSELVAQMDEKLKFPGTTNAWTMPIRARIDMLTTGVRTPVGIKVLGSDLNEVERIGVELEKIVNQVPGTRSVFAERITGGYFLDFKFHRDKLARYGISVGQAQESLMAAVGGEPVTKTVEGRERYTVNVRYHRDFRSDIESLKRVLIGTMGGVQIPMGQVADIEMVQGPSMIRNENGLLSSFVYVDVTDRDIGSYVEAAKKIVNEKIKLPSGIDLVWSGQYENMVRVKEKLKVIVPITLFIIVFLLFLNTKSWIKTSIILLAVPFSAVGAIWFLYFLDYNMSIAVWVGLIALLGVDAETGIFMLLYLDLAYEKALKAGKIKNFKDLQAAIHEGAVKRVRPKIMTVATLVMALLPIMWASTSKAGADVMKRIAAPMFGGIISSFAMELLVYPAIFVIWKWYFELKNQNVTEISFEKKPL